MEEQEKNQPQAKPEAKPHPHSKKLMVITIAVVILALVGIGFYATKTALLDKSGGSSSVVNTGGTDKPADAKKVSKELKELNLDEIKQAVSEIKSVISAF